MLEVGKPLSKPLTAPESGELSMGGLLEFLTAHPVKRVVFHYASRDIRSGYHITEVKSGSFVALDCGANPESWNELFIQLLDVASDGPHMAAGKFSAIIAKVSEHFALEGAAKLTFEVSDGVQPIRLFMASMSGISDGEMRIDLAARPASCKPRDRWLAEEHAAAASACCSGLKPAGKQACCS